MRTGKYNAASGFGRWNPERPHRPSTAPHPWSRPMDDLYKRLGVLPNASTKDIRSAYRRLVRTVHPDTSRSPETAAEFAKVTEAYRILIDPDKRAQYDRGETVQVTPITFYASHRQQVVAYQRKINRIVDEMIEEDRRETHTRGQIVTVLVTLFLSTFIFALVKPLRFAPSEWPVAVGAGVFSLIGIFYLLTVIRRALEHYTYRPPAPSVTTLEEPPSKPFARATALTFLGVGYGGSLAAGVLLDMASGGAFSGGGFPKDAMMGAVLLPPILVLVIATLRRVGEKMEGL